jgi:HSP20 family protein
MVRRNGGLPLLQLRGEMDRLFSDFFGPPEATPWARRYPAVNVWEDGDNLKLEAELPGVITEDLDIAVVGNELTIKGRRAEPENENRTFHRRERPTGEFVRMLRLPYEIDAGNVTATLNNGVLTVTLPKAESAKPRKIQVKATS